MSSAKTQPVFFLNVEGDLPVLLSFAIERDGEIIATTGEVMNYEANAVVGRSPRLTSANVKIAYPASMTVNLPPLTLYTS